MAVTEKTPLTLTATQALDMPVVRITLSRSLQANETVSIAVTDPQDDSVVEVEEHSAKAETFYVRTTRDSILDVDVTVTDDTDPSVPVVDVIELAVPSTYYTNSCLTRASKKATDECKPCKSDDYHQIRALLDAANFNIAIEDYVRARFILAMALTFCDECGFCSAPAFATATPSESSPVTVPSGSTGNYGVVIADTES